MPDDPADIRGGPHHLARADAVDVAHGPGERDQIAGGRPHHALGRPGRAGGIEDVERIHPPDRRAGCGRNALLEACPVEIAPLDQRRLRLGPLQHHAEVRLVVGKADRLVHHRLVGNDPARLDAAGGRDHRLRRGVVDADRKLRRREAAEDHRMDRAEPGAGQHRHQRLGDHRHVEHDPVALADAPGGQRPGQPGHLVAQLGIAQAALRPGDGRVVEDGRPVAMAGLDMTVDGVPAGIALPVGEPAIDRRPAVLQRAGGRAVPVDRRRGLQPEAFGIGFPSLVDCLVAHAVLPQIQARHRHCWRHPAASPLGRNRFPAEQAASAPADAPRG